IRGELGLPRAISTRSRLIGSAAGLFVIGLGLGAAAGGLGYRLMFTDSPVDPQPTAPPTTALAVGQAAADLDLFDPGTLAQMQVSGLLADASDAAVDPNPARSSDPAAPNMAGADRPGASDKSVGGTTGTTLNESGFLSDRLTDLRTDPEWDSFLLGRIKTLHDRGGLPAAAVLIEQLRRPETRFERGAAFADSLWFEQRFDDAKDLYQRLAAATVQQSDHGGARVAAYCTLSRHMALTARPVEADQLLEQAQASTAAITGAADRAAAQGEIAALLSNLGRPTAAGAAFKATTQGLAQIQDPAERLTAIAWLAPAYAQAGYRASALNLLEEAARHSDTVKDPRQRATILDTITATQGLLGDLPGAKASAARIANPAWQDRTRYRLTVAAVASDRFANALELAEGLQTPVYQALASGLLGLRLQDQPAFSALAAPAAQRAVSLLTAIANPAEKAAVTAELGRFAARRGDLAAADRYFADASRLAEGTPAGVDRDRTLAILATNQALALRLAEARRTLAKITDGVLRLALTNDLKALEPAITAVGIASPAG
ncbi:MAG TPA: hypothetical protein VES73_10710, partial [Lamprocystis sp. (in: g-proteobacteria)]|nr:hypothetical protein [Lamprocystis sp. (in: g-proteobacteria)]